MNKCNKSEGVLADRAEILRDLWLWFRFLRMESRWGKRFGCDRPWGNGDCGLLAN